MARKKEPISMTIHLRPVDSPQFRQGIRLLVQMAVRKIRREQEEHETEIKTKEKEG